MPLIKADVPLDGGVGNGSRPRTKLQVLYEQLLEKQRELRLLEIEMQRTDPNELADDTDGMVPSQED
jgi:hypothetical protein